MVSASKTPSSPYLHVWTIPGRRALMGYANNSASCLSAVTFGCIMQTCPFEYVGLSRFAVHRGVPLGATKPRVGSLILLPNGRIDLNDAPGKAHAIQHPHQSLSQQFAGDSECVAGEEVTPQT